MNLEQGLNDKYSWGQGQGHCWHGTGFVSSACEPLPQTCICTARMQSLLEDLPPCVARLMTSEVFLGMGENEAGTGKNCSASS